MINAYEHIIFYSLFIALMALETLNGEEFLVEEIIEHLGHGWFQYQLFFFCGLPFIADFAQIFLNPFIIPGIREEFQCTTFTASLIPSCLFLGMLIGSILFGSFSDRFGRRLTFLLCLGCTGFFGALSALCTSLPLLMAMRTLCGLGVGGFHVSMTLYAEYLPKHTRTMNLTLIQSFISLGSISTCAIAWGLHSQSWRFLTVICASISIFCALPFYILPESSRFLVSQGRHAEAIETLKNIANKNRKALPQHFSIVRPHVHAHSSFAFLREKTLRCLVAILGALWFVAAFLYYGANFISAQVPYGGNQRAKVVLISCAELVSLGNTFALSAHFGRKRAISICGLCGCFTLTVLLFARYLHSSALIAAMFIFRGLAASFVAIVCMYTAEAFPTAHRSTGFGIVSACSRIGGICTPWISIAFAALRFEQAIAVYLVTLLIGSFIAFKLPFETRDKAMDATKNESLK